ncbi:EVE domain-containing protein [Loktanella sp. IMCC34160]|uniref:EVE domain-containing protein n=1 Tax=Loktanella sp. IMCC34160 TaxID=2510646 RepID=UPI00101C25E8|nr:EVE domain-containing protein [Loktanella sp. IMCC34160]RYG91617.1 EVE domain-containing protein [Loktanella sp. IMCC34160]
MAKWLFKSEPDVFGWSDLVARGDKGEQWDGVRNYQARNNMRAMTVGDLGFFYHSRTGLEIVGVVEVIAPAHPDSTTDDPRWECVDVRALRPFAKPVTMQAIKSDPRLSEMVLVKNSRLSVQPVTDEEWRMICEMGETAA